MAGITLSLAQARTLFEDHFKVDMPGDLKYIDAAFMVMNECGAAEFLTRLDALERDGSYKIDNKGGKQHG